MKVTVCWHINNWTNQGPGSIGVHCTISDGKFDGSDGRPGLHTNSGNCVRYDTFEKFMELLDLCRACVKKIKAGPQETYSRVRESVSVEGYIESNKYGYTTVEWRKRFYDYGSTSPRHRFEDMRDSGGFTFIQMINDYIDDVDDAPPACIIEDYIKEFYNIGV